jgi:hypothetical protein
LASAHANKTGIDITSPGPHRGDAHRSGCAAAIRDTTCRVDTVLADRPPFELIAPGKVKRKAHLRQLRLSYSSGKSNGGSGSRPPLLLCGLATLASRSNPTSSNTAAPSSASSGRRDTGREPRSSASASKAGVMSKRTRCQHTGLLVEHAWVTMDNIHAIDVTWTDPERASYFGVPIPTVTLASSCLSETNCLRRGD